MLGPPIYPEVDVAANGEDRVPHLLRLEPAEVEPPEQVVLGVEREGLGIGPGCHPVGVRGDDQAMHRLERPSLGDELAGQPVEQLGMGWRRPFVAEIAGGADHPPAEVMLPDPVDHHPGRQRVRRAGDPVGQDSPTTRTPAPSAGGAASRGRLGRDHRRKPRLDLRPRRSRVASAQDERLRRRRAALGHAKGLGSGPLQGIPLASERLVASKSASLTSFGTCFSMISARYCSDWKVVALDALEVWDEGVLDGLDLDGDGLDLLPVLRRGSRRPSRRGG